MRIQPPSLALVVHTGWTVGANEFAQRIAINPEHSRDPRSSGWSGSRDPCPLVAKLRGDLLSTIGSWLEDARRELPVAARHLQSVAGGSIDEISSALQQFEQTLSDATTAELPSGTPGGVPDDLIHCLSRAA